MRLEGWLPAAHASRRPRSLSSGRASRGPVSGLPSMRSGASLRFQIRFVHHFVPALERGRDVALARLKPRVHLVGERLCHRIDAPSR